MKKPYKSDQMDPLEILREEARAAAVCHGVDRCDDLAKALVERFTQRLGGFHVYVPKKSSQARGDIALKIRAKFDGTNIRELSKEFCLSTRHVRRLLAS